VVRRIETIFELIGAIEDKIFAAEYVHDVRRRRSGEQQCRTRSGVDNAVRGIHRDGKYRTFLPFKREFLRIAVNPNFGGASAIDDEELLLVHMFFGVECTGSGNFADVTTPDSFVAEALDDISTTLPTLPNSTPHLSH